MNEKKDSETENELTPEELAARKRRNIWLALSLLGFVGLILLVTMVRLASGIPERM